MNLFATTDRDWPEDEGLENGSYRCRCLTCEEEFTGHVDRVTCRRCTVPPPGPPDPNAASKPMPPAAP